MAPKKRTVPKASSEAPKPGDAHMTNGIPDTATHANAELQPLDRSSLLKQIHATMPLPIREEVCADGSLVYVGGDPGEVVIRIAQDRITVSMFEIEWEGSHTPVVSPQPLMELHWKCLPAKLLTTFLHEMIEVAGKLRRSKYRKCERCGDTKPPEWMHDNGSCQSCDERST